MTPVAAGNTNFCYSNRLSYSFVGLGFYTDMYSNVHNLSDRSK